MNSRLYPPATPAIVLVAASTAPRAVDCFLRVEAPDPARLYHDGDLRHELSADVWRNSLWKSDFDHIRRSGAMVRDDFQRWLEGAQLRGCIDGETDRQLA